MVLEWHHQTQEKNEAPQALVFYWFLQKTIINEKLIQIHKAYQVFFIICRQTEIKFIF